jgi:hypothetical protein
MRVEAIGFERLPAKTPDNLAYHYLVGFAPQDTDEWWSDFLIKEIAFDKDSAVLRAKRLQEKLKSGMKFVPELDSTRLWRVCIVDIKQPNKQFSEK